MRVLESFGLQAFDDVLVAEEGPVITLCDLIGIQREFLLYLALGLADPLAYVLTRGLANLNEALILGRGVLW